MRRKPRLTEAETGLMRNIMTQQPAMPSRHVCQVKYRKVGLEQGDGDIRYRTVPMPAAERAQQGGAVPRYHTSHSQSTHCASLEHAGCPRCLQERAQRGDGTSQGSGQTLAASPQKRSNDGLWGWRCPGTPEGTGSVRQYVALPAAAGPTQPGTERRRRGGKKLLFSLIVVFPER